MAVEAPVAPSTAASDAAANGAVAGPPQWFTRTRDGDPWAGYGPPNSEASFSVRCDSGAGQLIFNTTATPPSGPGETAMELSAPGIDQSLEAVASEEGLPNTSASVAADAEWLARLATVTGNLTIQVGGGDPLVVPIGTELTSLIRDCRR